MHIYDLDTPAVVLDLDMLERNIREMAALCAQIGIALRVHTKTHRTPEIAQMQDLSAHYKAPYLYAVAGDPARAAYYAGLRAPYLVCILFLTAAVFSEVILIRKRNVPGDGWTIGR